MDRGWKSISGLVPALIIIIVIIIFSRSANQLLIYSIPLCNTLTEKPIEALIRKDFPDSWKTSFSPKVAEVMAVNDMRCETEYMANVAIILSGHNKIKFGIFHIHFSPQATLLTSSVIFPWKQYPDRNDPGIDAVWKKFVQIVYPKE